MLFLYYIWGIKMTKSTLRDSSKNFAKQIIILCRDIKETKKDSVLTNQLLRAATSVGANIYEAQYAQSTNDFISKLEIALKECYESEYWLEPLFETGYVEEERFLSLHNSGGALRRMLISSLNTIKQKNT